MSKQNQQQSKPSNISRVAIIIACILFVVGLVVYVSSSGNVEIQEQTQMRRENTKTQDVTELPSAGTTPKATRVEGHVIVKFKNGVTDEQITARLLPLNASIESKIEGINTTVLNVPPGKEDAILAELSKDPLVQYAEPDYVYYLQFVPNDPQVVNQWGLINTGQTINGKTGKADADIDAEFAWDVSKGTGVKVAILDSGIDITHPELGSKVIGNKVFSTTSLVDKNGHGTHVAGILAANANNGQGISGVCPDCQLLIGKITNDDATGSVPTAAIAPSIIWAADSGAQVINMSIAGPSFSQAVQDAVNYAWGKNAVIVAAAGNLGTTAKNYPAAYTNVVSVANTNMSDGRTASSSYGTWVTIAAPGDNIVSTLPTVENLRGITGYGIMGGTSMASPAVAGVAALVWKTQYGTNNAAVVQRIYATADKIAGTGTNWQNGRINAAAAVGANTNPSVAPSVVPSTNPAPSSVVPTFVCGGSTNSICPIPSTTGTVLPSGSTTIPTTGSTQPITPVPSGSTVNPTIPCETGTTSIAHSKKSKHKHRKRGGVNKFMNWILRFFIEIINWILKLFGGGQIPSPVDPGDPCSPVVDPNPVPSTEPSEVPSQAQPSSGAAPSGQVIVPSAAISAAISQPASNGSPTATTCTGTGPGGSLDYTGWTMTGCDDFNGTALDTSKWGAYEGAGHGGNGRRLAAQARVANGMVTLTGTPNGDTAGLAWQNGQLYGRWEGRMKAAVGCGCYHPVLLLWPDAEDWPAGGEVDYAEQMSGDRQSINFFLHYSASNQQTSASKDIDVTQWHNYAVEWTATHVKGYIDGQEWFSDTNTSHVPPRAMHQTIQFDWFPGDGSFSGNSTMDVDWIHIYSKS